MPKLSDSMEEGKVLTWLKKEGERVTKGEAIAEVETEKADMEIEAFATGVLAEIRVQAGESAPVGEVIALIQTEDEAASGRPEAAAPKTEESAKVEAARQPDEDRKKETIEQTEEKKEEKKEEEKEEGKVSAPAPRRKPASPMARKLARERGIDLEETDIEGSGPGGRITSDDVQQYLEKSPSSTRPATATEEGGKHDAKAAAAPATPKPGIKASEAPAKPRDAASRLRSVIARRMTESKTSVPHFYVSVDVDMTECARLKEGLAEITAKGQAPGYNAIVLKAVALALERHPEINAAWVDGSIRQHEGIHVGFAVEVEGGLLVPVIHDCNKRSLQEITNRARDLAQASRSGKMKAEDFSGGTFTVSNLGMFGIGSFTAIINPPQAGILAVGAVLDKPVARAGRVEVAPTMTITLSCDHRVTDGARGARFLAELKSMLENPLGLLIGA